MANLTFAFFIRSSSFLLVAGYRKKSRMSLILDQIRLFPLENLALRDKKVYLRHVLLRNYNVQMNYE